MKTQNYREPVLTKIISIDGSDLLKRGYTALKNGKLDPDAFRGVMDDSLDTLKLEEVYKAHRADFPFPYLADKIYCRALVNVSFDYAVKEFEQVGRRFVRYGYTVTDSDMTDHVCVRNGELIAVEVPYQKDTQYAPVQQPIDADLLGDPFEYDAKAQVYRGSEKEALVKNKIWDGEALLDASVFLENGYENKGMLLLRNRFFKTCAFNTNLQEWFADNCITKVSQLAGYTTARKIEDIKLVITESSLKYLKFIPKGMPYPKPSVNGNRRNP